MRPFGKRPALAGLGLLTVVGALGPRTALAEGQIWTEAGLRYRPIKKLRLELDQHLRLGLDPAEVVQVMPEVSASYDVLDWLRVRAAYRLIYMRNKFERFETWHRFSGDVRARGKWKKIRVGNRVRFQEQITSEFGKEDKHTLRNEFSLGYDTDRMIEPQVAAELFYRFGGKRGSGVHKYRLEAGITGAGGGSDFSLLYRVEVPVADDNDPTLHIAVLQYHFTL